MWSERKKDFGYLKIIFLAISQRQRRRRCWTGSRRREFPRNLFGVESQIIRRYQSISAANYLMKHILIIIEHSANEKKKNYWMFPLSCSSVQSKWYIAWTTRETFYVSNSEKKISKTLNFFYIAESADIWKISIDRVYTPTDFCVSEKLRRVWRLWVCEKNHIFIEWVRSERKVRKEENIENQKKKKKSRKITT